MLSAIDLTGYSGEKVWCGPAAVSILTGVPLQRSTMTLAEIAGEDFFYLAGTYEEEVLRALRRFGYKATPSREFADRYPTSDPTLLRYMSHRTPPEKLRMMLVEVTGHWVTAHLDRLADGWTKRPVPMAEFPKLGRRVRAVWGVEKL